MTTVSEQTSAVTDIITRLEEILVGIGFELEDLSSTDPNTWTTDPLAQLLITGEEFDDVTNENVDTASLSFNVKIGFKYETPGDSRDYQYYWAHECRDNINTTNINSVDKLVRTTLHDGWDVEYNGTYSIVNYNITIRYRNEAQN